MDAHALARDQFKLAFELGREAGHADLQARLEVAEANADHWYLVANNPGFVDAQRRRWLSWQEVRDARAEQDRLRAQWDAAEHDLFERAKQMMWDGADDLTIAVTLGLYLPLVSNLRCGVVS